MSSTIYRFAMRRGVGVSIAALVAVALSGCAEDGSFNLKEALNIEPKGEEVVARAASGVDTIERDVEAPEVFEAREAGLWDGRPSLGGVWVAHPDVDEPERVLIRNTTNDKFVVGALFRRERDIPGPRLQASSDAAEALGLLPGAPSQLEVVALRKEVVSVEPDAPVVAEAIEEAPAVETAALDPLAGLDAAIEAAPAPATAAVAPAAATPTPSAAAPKPTRSVAIEKPYLQIGIFSVEDNADRAAGVLRNAGMIPTTKTFEQNGKTFWRVVVGPAQNTTERGELLAQIKKEGYTDAYAVRN